MTIPHVHYLDKYRQGRVQIHNRVDRKLIAVLELLSPANKIGSGRAEYLAKRENLLRQKIHLLELDLLVGGKRPPLSAPLPPADYYVYIARANQRPDCQVYHWAVRDPLPTIPIPLKAPDADIRIDLAKVFHATLGATAMPFSDLRPKAMPMTPLKPADAKWAKSLSARKPA